MPVLEERFLDRVQPLLDLLQRRLERGQPLLDDVEDEPVGCRLAVPLPGIADSPLLLQPR